MNPKQQPEMAKEPSSNQLQSVINSDSKQPVQPLDSKEPPSRQQSSNAEISKPLNNVPGRGDFDSFIK